MARLPSLNSLKAFDAASRNLSFTKAARELFVTHGAVSRQVAQLEVFLDTQLFVRSPRGLKLTPQGADFSEDIQAIFKKLNYAVDQVRAAQERPTVTINTMASFAARWLVPRLGRYADIDIHVATTRRIVDLDHEAADIAIRSSPREWPQYESRVLFTPSLFPACSPALIRSGRTLASFEALKEHDLFHDETHDGWRLWFKRNGLPENEARRGHVFEDLNVVIQAGIAGKGIILVPTQLIEEEIRLGLLTHPFAHDQNLEPVHADPFLILASKERAMSSATREVFEWLYESAELLRKCANKHDKSDFT